MFPLYSSFLRQPETTDEHDTSATTSEPVCYIEENDEFRERILAKFC